MGIIPEAIEQFFKKATEPVVNGAARVFGRSAASSFEKGATAATRVEPVLNETAAQVAERQAREAALKKADEALARRAARGPNASGTANEEALDVLAKAKASGEAGKGTATAAKVEAEAAGTAEKAAAKEAATESIKTAATGEKLSFLEARKIANSSSSLNGKLRDLTSGGQIDMAKRVAAEARFKGVGNEIDDVLQEASRPGSKIPKELVAELKKSHDIYARGWFFERWAEKGAAGANYLGSWAKGAVSHPLAAVDATWDVFAQQWRAPLAVAKTAKENKLAAAATLAVAVPAIASLDHATNGAVADLAGKTARGVGGAYVAADKAAINGVVAAGSYVGGVVTSKSAEEVAVATGDGAVSAAEKVPGFAGRLLNSALGEDASGFLERNPLAKAVLPDGVRAAMTVDKLGHKAAAALPPGVSPTGETVPVAPAPATTAPAGEPDADPDTARETAGMSAADRAKHIAAKAQKATADLADSQAAHKIEEMVKKGGLPAALGAFFGFDKNKNVAQNAVNMGIMATLFSLIWSGLEKLGIGGLFGGSSRSNQGRMDNAMRHLNGAQPVPQQQQLWTPDGRKVSMAPQSFDTGRTTSVARDVAPVQSNAPTLQDAANPALGPAPAPAPAKLDKGYLEASNKATDDAAWAANKVGMVTTRTYGFDEPAPETVAAAKPKPAYFQQSYGDPVKVANNDKRVIELTPSLG